MPVFTNPAAIWCSLILVGLIAIYLFKRRSRSHVVSSIMFFAKTHNTAEGGQKIHKIKTPIIFFIELLILILCLLAMANPMCLQKGKLIPITLILDDSISMSVGNDLSPKNKAVQYLKDNLFSQSLYRYTLIKAGYSVGIMGKRDMTAKEAENVLRDWECNQPSSDLDNAVVFAKGVSSAEAFIIVLTDHMTTNSYGENGIVNWLAFGIPDNNIGITAANRTLSGRVDKCFFEFTNYSDQKTEIDAEILDVTNGTVLEVVKGSISPESSRRIIIKTDNINSTIKAIVKNDKNIFDNEAVLLPLNRNQLRVSINLSDSILAGFIKKAVLACDMVCIVNDSPQVLITDKKTLLPDSAFMQIVILNGNDSTIISDNFAEDKEHPFMEGISFDHIIWSFNKSIVVNGNNILISGNTSLIWEENVNSKEIITINYDYKHSNAHLTSFWPIFFHNVMEYSTKKMPGLYYNNIRSGSSIKVCFSDNSKKAILSKLPNKTQKEEQYINFNNAEFIAKAPGLYEISSEKESYIVSVNLCSHEESDLRKAASSKEYPKIITDENMSHFENVRWWFIIAAFILLLIHQWYISKMRSGYAF